MPSAEHSPNLPSQADRPHEPVTLTPLPSRKRTVAAVLPRPLTSLIGRAAEVAAVRDQLLQPSRRLITLTGPGGVGKTRLAIAIGEEVAGSFPDGIVFVGLAPIHDPELVAPTIARALGVRETTRPRLMARLTTHLRPKDLLLILDNFEQVVPAGRMLAELLAECPRLKILVTSRATLHLSGERRIVVPPLSVPDPDDLPSLECAQTFGAVQLFRERAQAANADFAVNIGNIQAVAAICQHLDGLPLAIELAAARSLLFPAPAMLPRLAHRLPLLTGGPSDAPARLQTMRDAIAWSYDLLTPEEQALFRRLSVFVGGFDLAAAEAVAGGQESGVRGRGTTESLTPDSRLLTPLSSLLDKSLLRQVEGAGGEARVEMLETIREFGVEQLEASGEADAVRTAHAEYYLALAQEAELHLIVAGSASWVDRLALELPNLRAAMAYSLGRGRGGDILRLAGTLLSMTYARGDPAEGQRWLEAALAEHGDAAIADRVDALFTASAMAQLQGDFARAVAFSETALGLGTEGGYPFGKARALSGLGISAEWQGDLDRAAEFYEASYAVMKGIDDLGNMAHWRFIPLANLGDIALLQGQPARATALAEEALVQWRQDGYLWGIAQALGTQAAAACSQGHHGRAARLCDEALTQWLECSDLRGIAGTLATIAGVAGARGEFERAARLLGAAWAMVESVGVQYLGHHIHAERVRTKTRARLGEAVFTAAWRAGSALTLEQAIAEAREVTALQDEESPTHGLTSRELDVLRLLAGGRTDREIAELLFVSPRTVQSHVGSCFAKLGVNSRAEAAAFAVRNGVV